MRIGLVSPYSWSFQGGVNRHVEALAEEFLGRGHDVRVLAPVDPPGRLSRATHRVGAEPRELPDYLTPLGRTVGLRRQRRRLQPARSAGERLRAPAPRGPGGGIRRHPRARAAGAAGRLERRARRPRTPVVGTFHAYSTKPVPNYIASAFGARRMFNRLSARIAVSEAAAWTGMRWFGGEYTIVPNGVDIDGPPAGLKTPGEELRVLFVGRPEERKGLPILLTAFNALVEHVPCAADRDRRRGGGRQALARRPRAAAARSTSAAASPRRSCGPSCTPPTCSARRRSPVRASAWS